MEIIVQQRTLTIRGEQRKSMEGRNDRNGMMIRQSEHRSFQRSFTIPPDALVHSMKVKRGHEYLLIRIPKR